MKKLILIIAMGLTATVFGQELVKNSTLWYSIKDDEDTNKKEESKNKLERYFNVESAYIYAGGVLQSIVTNKHDSESSPTGSLGFNFDTERIVFNLFYSYNTRSVFQMDSLHKLGGSLLQTNTLGQSFSIGTYCMLHPIVALNFRASVSDDLWQINDSTKLDASPFQISLGFRFIPFNFQKIESNKLKFYIDASFTHRTILGDFKNGRYQIGEQIIDQGGYNGFELTTNFAFDNLGLFVSYSVNPKDNYFIPGFTGSQVIFGVKLTAKALTLK